MTSAETRVQMAVQVPAPKFCQIQVTKQEKEGLRIRGASVLLILGLLSACGWSSGRWFLPIAGGLFTVMGSARALWKHLRREVSRPKYLWGSHLRTRKAQEAELARALSALMAKVLESG